MHWTRFRHVVLSLALLAGGALPAVAQDAWSALRDHGIGLMRHGGAVVAGPGEEAPVPGCEVSAVLTDIGREEMRRFGERLHAEGITNARIHVSRQCSAWETALLLGLGPLTHDPSLDPPGPGEASARRDALERALQAAVKEARNGPVIFITHRSNIFALTGIELPQGEILVLRAQAGATLRLAGRITAE